MPDSVSLDPPIACDRGAGPSLLWSWSISRGRIFRREPASVCDACHDAQQWNVRRSVVYEVVSQPAATSDRSWPRSIRTVSCERRNPRCFPNSGFVIEDLVFLLIDVPL